MNTVMILQILLYIYLYLLYYILNDIMEIKVNKDYCQSIREKGANEIKRMKGKEKIMSG